MTKTTRKFFLLGLLIISTLFAHAQKTYQVPDDFASIQLAIDKARSGDTIVVAPGTYIENINFLGKDIYLTSEYLYTGNNASITSTIIDGSQPASPDTASVVRIVGGETQNAVLRGFTITKGKGTKTYNGNENLFFRTGGGITVDGASPTIINNIIIRNSCTVETGVAGAGGGGLRVGFGLPYIANNIITKNSGGYAGGIMIAFCEGMILENNIISYNHSDGDFGGGGGVYVDWEDIFIINNTIINNDSDGSGGGFCMTGNKSVIKNCIIYGNTAVIPGTEAVRKRFDGDPKISYCNVEGGWPGAGNINANPKYKSRSLSFELSPSSPCIDAGDPDEKYFDQMNPESGTVYLPARGGVRNDMGAYGGPSYVRVAGFVSGVNNTITALPFELTNKRNIVFVNQNKRGYLYLRVFNRAGQLMEILHDGIIEKGTHQFNLSNSGFQLVQALDTNGRGLTIKTFN